MNDEEKTNKDVYEVKSVMDRVSAQKGSLVNLVGNAIKFTLIEPDWKVAFGALAIAVKDAKGSGDFTECEKIIAAMYNTPRWFTTTEEK